MNFLRTPSADSQRHILILLSILGLLYILHTAFFSFTIIYLIYWTANNVEDTTTQIIIHVWVSSGTMMLFDIHILSVCVIRFLFLYTLITQPSTVLSPFGGWIISKLQTQTEPHTEQNTIQSYIQVIKHHFHHEFTVAWKYIQTMLHDLMNQIIQYTYKETSN